MQGFTQSRYTTKTAPEGYLDTLRQSCEVKVWKWNRIYYRKKKQRQLRLEVPTKKRVKITAKKRHPIYGTLRLLRNLFRLSIFVIAMCYIVEFIYIRPIKPRSAVIKVELNPVRFTEEELKAFYKGEKYEAHAEALPVAQVVESLEKKTPEELVKKYFGEIADEALTCFKSESGLRPTAINYSNKNGTWDIGYAQINTIHCGKVGAKDREDCKNKLLDVETNIKVAKQIYDGRGFNAWYGSTCRQYWK